MDFHLLCNKTGITPLCPPPQTQKNKKTTEKSIFTCLGTAVKVAQFKFCNKDKEVDFTASDDHRHYFKGLPIIKMWFELRNQGFRSSKFPEEPEE